MRFDQLNSNEINDFLQNLNQFNKSKEYYRRIIDIAQIMKNKSRDYKS